MCAWADNLFLFCVSEWAARMMLGSLIPALADATWSLKWEETELLHPLQKAWCVGYADLVVPCVATVQVLGIPVVHGNSSDERIT